MGFTPSKIHPATRLRQLLARDEALFMPGCYDALSARMIETSGFEAAAISGFAVEAALLGGPDIGLITMSELAGHARCVTNAVDIPIITDVDTGFGGVQNIYRTVRAMEQAGLAGLHIEDQRLPKKCPVLPGRIVVSVEEASDRYAVACEARTNPDFLIIARSDADILSYDEQIRRSNAYLSAGADMVLPMMIELDGAPFSNLDPDDQMTQIARTVADLDGPMMYVGPPPAGYGAGDLAQAGVKLISHSAVTIEAAANAMKAILAELREQGVTRNFYEKLPNTLPAGRPLLDLMRVEHYLDLETRYPHGSR